MYLKAQLEARVKAEHVALRSRWFSQWRHEYGLSLRRPNRRYTVPKAVLAERLETGWLNVYRVRAAAAAMKGDDPARRTGAARRFIASRQAQKTSRRSQVRVWKCPWWRRTLPRVCGGRPS